MDEALRVVVDTNVFIDYLFLEDKDYTDLIKPIFIYECNRDIQFVFCKQTVNELNNKIKDICSKLKYTKEQIFYVTSELAHIFARSYYVVVDGQIPRYCMHHHDDVFIQCAIFSNAKSIISSDAHLSNLPESTKYLYKLKIDLMEPLDFLKDYELIKKIHSFSRLNNVGNIRITSNNRTRP